MKKLVKLFSGILFVLMILYFLRTPIFNSAGNFLVYEKEFKKIETAFVLSGGAFDRGNMAANLLNENKIGQVICVGGNITPNFKALNIEMLESELTRKNIISQISDTSKVVLIKEGTSTLEESEAILDYCKQNNIQKCLIVSSMFHTRRIKNVFVEKFKEQRIEVFIKGSPSSSYLESEWWKSENGLIALNNEYIKLFYYALK